MDVILAGAIRIELISLVLETKAQPLYQTPKQRAYYITKKTFCQLFFDIVCEKFSNWKKSFRQVKNGREKEGNFIYGRRLFG